MTRERSHAYPVLDLAAAYRILRSNLADLGADELHRDTIAEKLGYRTSLGGLAARKVGALVQLGLLTRRGACYGLSPLGMVLQRLDLHDAEFPSAIRAALEKPVLFRSILGAFRKTGRIPSDLAEKLAGFGIAAGARNDAAKVFFESALFAGVIDLNGVFLGEGPMRPADAIETRPLAQASSEGQLGETTAEAGAGQDWHEIPLMLSDLRFGYLKLPRSFQQEDYELLLESFQDIYSKLQRHFDFQRLAAEPTKEAEEAEVSSQVVKGPWKDDRQV